MKTRFSLGLVSIFAGFASVGAACTVTETVYRTDPPPAAQPGPDGAVEDAGPEPDAPIRPTSCAPKLVDPTCATTKPAPTTSAAITSFVKDVAVPLRCSSAPGSSDALWDLRPLIDLYGSQKIFMMGEVHGSNEIGIVSSLVFEQLASQKLVNVLASELPMDFEEPLQRYVDTGSDPTAQQILPSLAPNFFGRILTQSARQLAAKGTPIRIGAVDIPTSPEFAVEAIQTLANKLTTQKETVLATLPTSASFPPSAQDITKVNAYFDHITSKKTQICAELSASDCDRLEAMTHALWATTLQDDRGGDDALWFERREVVIYYNMRAAMPDASSRMFLHMGAAHTNKHTFSAGSRMTKEYALTKGQVFSVAPAYGDGSVIWYGRDMDLPGEPRTLTSALTDAPEHPFFVSTTRPNASCEANPVGEENDDTVGGGTRGELYDGYIHYGKLTSERRPSDATLSRDIPVAGSAGAAPGSKAAALIAFRERIERRERAAIRAGVLTRVRRH